MTPLIIDSRVVLFRNILTPGHSVRVRGSIYCGGSKYFVTPVPVFYEYEIKNYLKLCNQCSIVVNY